MYNYYILKAQILHAIKTRAWSHLKSVGNQGHVRLKQIKNFSIQIIILYNAYVVSMYHYEPMQVRTYQAIMMFITCYFNTIDN